MNTTPIQFLTDNGKVLFVKDKYVYPFAELSCTDADALRREMECNPQVNDAIVNAFPDPIVQLEKFASYKSGAFKL